MPGLDAGALRSIASRLRPDAATLLLAAAALIGAALILAREVNYGVAANLDSTAYVSAARNAADGNGFVVLHNQSPYVNYPPLFPAALAVGDLLGADPLTFAGWLNAAAFGLAVFVASLWLRRRVQSRFVLAWAVIALVIAPPLVYVGSLAGSDALFVCFALGALLCADAFRRDRSRSLLVWAGVFTMLALLTRYVGVSLAAATIAFLLLGRGAPLRRRVENAALYSAIALTPIAIWLMRNLIQIGAFTNHSQFPPDNAFSYNLATLGRRFTEALLGWSGLERFIASRLTGYADRAELSAALVGCALPLAVGVPAAALLYLKVVRPRSRWPRPPGAALVLGLFAVVYAAVVTAAISYQGVERFSIRYFAPLYVMCFLIAALLLDRLFSALRNRGTGDAAYQSNPARPRSWISAAVAAALILWLLPQADFYADRFQRHLNYGFGVTSKGWRQSEVIRYLRANPPQGEYDIASNVRGELYLLVGLPATHRQIPCDPENLRGLARWRHSDGEDLYVIWSDRRELCITPGEIEAALNAEVEAEFSDGGVLAARKPG